MFIVIKAESTSSDQHIDKFNQVCDTIATIDKALDEKMRHCY